MELRDRGLLPHLGQLVVSLEVGLVLALVLGQDLDDVVDLQLPLDDGGFFVVDDPVLDVDLANVDRGRIMVGVVLLKLAGGCLSAGGIFGFAQLALSDVDLRLGWDLGLGVLLIGDLIQRNSLLRCSLGLEFLNGSFQSLAVPFQLAL